MNASNSEGSTVATSRRRWAGFPLFSGVLLAAAACVTINVYFPEEAVQDLSEQIEEEVQKRAAEIEQQEGVDDTGTADDAGTGGGGAADAGDGGGALGRNGLLSLLLGASPAYAQEVAAPEVSNPAIRRIIDSRAKRVSEIDQLKAQGVVGENNLALLELRDLEAITDLRRRADAQRLVREENADRKRLFEEIAAAKNVDRSQLGKIQETYAGTLRDQARKGDWIQMPDGRWKQK
jgi:uncharacterized protein YdbL (DUF1318 family)